MEQDYKDYLDMALHLGAAWLAGSLIGLERSFHGRPAGFRTHALVCLASAALMVVTTAQWRWLEDVPLETIRTDPTRMAAGIMTGVGFLGAGVIFKGGLTVRGLTTAASIWMTAALGILYGVGVYVPALLVTGAALGTLATFRLIEYAIPSQLYAQLIVRYPRLEVPDEAAVRALVAEFSIRIASISYRLTEGGQHYEYAMVIRTYGKNNFRQLARRLLSEAGVTKFSLTPMGE
jgi:putative Mg2+ transporter-C (MgtC) family protein